METVAPNPVSATPPSVKPSRELEMDLLRGLAILAVVFVHVASLGEKIDTRLAHEVVEAELAALRWCVPVFIAISAYFLSKSSQRLGNAAPMEEARFIGRRMLRLFIPFFIWSCVYLPIYATKANLTPVKLITVHFAGAAWAGQYYFIVLFQIVLLQPILRRIKVGDGLLLATLCFGLPFYMFVTLAAARHPLMAKIGDRPFFYWLPFVFLGMWFAANQQRLERRAALFSVPLILVCLLMLSMGPPMEHHLVELAGIKPTMPYMEASVFFLSMATLPGLWLLLRRRTRFAADGLLKLLGKYSLGIFCLNPLVVYELFGRTVFGQSALHSMPQWLLLSTPLLLTPIAMAICVACCALLDKAGAQALVR
jgi:surface polysaccharide O-acyltransferase-like enzyme